MYDGVSTIGRLYSTMKVVLKGRALNPIIFGKNDLRVRKLVREAGYVAALAMSDRDEMFAGSENLLAIGRFGQSRLEELVDRASGGKPISCSEQIQPNLQPIPKS